MGACSILMGACSSAHPSPSIYSFISAVISLELGLKSLKEQTSFSMSSTPNIFMPSKSATPRTDGVAASFACKRVLPGSGSDFMFVLGCDVQRSRFPRRRRPTRSMLLARKLFRRCTINVYWEHGNVVFGDLLCECHAVGIPLDFCCGRVRRRQTSGTRMRACEPRPPGANLRSPSRLLLVLLLLVGRVLPLGSWGSGWST